MQKDFIIVLAWPEGMVTASNSWYDKFFSQNNKYRVGHSAIVLLNFQTKKLYYFDFGRYHSPFGFGRVRDSETDPDVNIEILAEIKGKEILNIKEILNKIKNNKACHGEGTLYASILNDVSFEKGIRYAKKQQNKGFIEYGPFVRNGTNCSRFVAAVMRKSSPAFIKNARLKFPISLSPSPKRNVGIANANFYKVTETEYVQVKRNKIVSYLKSIER